MTKFEVGRVYRVISIEDNNAFWFFEVTHRTSKQVTFNQPGDPTQFKKRINLRNDVEVAYPFGKYPMCPMLNASRAVDKEN